MEIINIHSKIRDYEIKIDDNLNKLIENSIDKSQRYFIVLDNKLSNNWRSFLLEMLPNSVIFEIEGGENSKSFEKYEQVINEMSKNEISKDDCLIAFGGGTITDLTGYVASTYKRGINFINIPTTTLAMVDASVGGKNAINLKQIKNGIGTIYPPLLVLIGLDVLDTLSEEHINNGLFESLKSGLIEDPSLYELFKCDYKSKIYEIVHKSILVKKKYVELDEEDLGVRKILNYGHTFGHAIESASSFEMLHGEAIAHGMLIASQTKPFFDELKDILSKMNLPKLPEIDHKKLLKYIKQDKKSVKNGVYFIEVNNIGHAEIISKTLDDLERMAIEYGI